jgi:hypothetical protein
MPGFDAEDKNANLGDPSTESTTPLNQKQTQGAQKATVNRTQLPSAKGKPGSADPQTKEGAAGDSSKQPDPQGQPSTPAGQVDPNTPVLGGLQAIQNEADKAIGLNPAHAQDWWKHAVESPVETYFLGKHIYNAFYGAFLGDAGHAMQSSVSDIWNQDNAFNKLMQGNPEGGGAASAFSKPPTPTAKDGLGPKSPATEFMTGALPLTADPTNIIYAGPGVKGAAMVAKFMGPGVASAIFTNAHTPTDLAWAIIPAMIFGTKLPPGMAAKVEAAIPGASKLFEKMSATKMAQDANKTAQQQGQDLYQHIIKSGALGPKNDILASAWEPGMQAATKEQTNALTSAMSEKYGTLDPEKLIPALVRDGASTTLLRNVWTKLARMHYDLPSVAEGEGAMVDPMSHRMTLPAAAQQELDNLHPWNVDMIMQAYVSPASHDLSPITSNLRSMTGADRNTGSVLQNWTGRLRAVVGAAADNPQEWALFSRSIEPSGREAEVAYQSLSPQWKVVRDSVRMVAAAAGMANEDLGLIQRTHGYLPRIGLMVKDGKGMLRGLRPRSLLTTTSAVHRTQAVRSVDTLTETRMQVEQAYKTTKEAQQAVGRQRNAISEAILNRTPWHDVLRETGAGVPASDLKEIEQIQADLEKYPDVAKLEAEAYAKRLVPDFSENPWDALHKFGGQIRAATAARAMQDLMGATLKGGKAVAIPKPTDSRAIDKAASQGYVSMNLPGFGRAMVHSDYAKLLTEMSHLNAKQPTGWMKKVLELEGTAVTMIMFAPRIHGINMSGRLAIAMTRFGPDIREWLHAGMLQKGGGTMLPPMIPGVKGSSEVGADAYRMVARNAGVIPYMPAKGMAGSGFAEKAIQHIGDMFGDTDMGRVPVVRDMANSTATQKASSAAQEVLGKVGDVGSHLWGKQSELWSWVSDFGVMMYWVEKAAALRSGRFEDAARKAMDEAGTVYDTATHQSQADKMASQYAAARANSWMGHVAPEDTNPWLHATLKSAFFAPNYWRTWGEILTGYYKNAGFGWSKDTIKYVVENEIKTAAAAVLFQQLSANALNMAFSGHTIYQNDPGNWGKVEITSPWAVEAYNEYVKATLPKDKQAAALIDPKTGRDGKGAKLTWENPSARQTTDTEQAMGFLTSAPHWDVGTFGQGFSAFGAARTSPVAASAAALANIDLYRSISSGGTRYVDPNHDTLGGNPLSDVITAAGDLTPFSGIGSQIQSQVMQGNVGEIQGPFGLPIPQAVANAFTPGSLGQDAGKAFLAGMTGVNPPYMRSSKTQGVSPTDDQYKSVHELQTVYEQQMNSLSTSTLSGQMAPYQWLATYRQLSAQHAAKMQAIFMHAPEYANGPLGLTNSWEGLYDQATDKNGVLQPDKLRTLQHQWRSSHAATDYTAVQNELRTNDTKYPMVALYHKAYDAYDNWQADWCKDPNGGNGLDLATLQSEISGWSAVYNDRTVSAQWVRDHPDITQFENAKKSEFESGQSHYGEAGLMFALFFNPTAADRYMLTSGETAQQIEQAAQQEQVPPAP